GAVQHGASTLPAELFGEFPRRGACEIHLATEFQNMIFDHPGFPADLKKSVYDELRVSEAADREPPHTDRQPFYQVRKKALGAGRQDVGGLQGEFRKALGAKLEERFTFLLTQLAVQGTRKLAEMHAPPVPGSFPTFDEALGAAKGPEDVSGLSD